jgi:hypothetical protein
VSLHGHGIVHESPMVKARRMKHGEGRSNAEGSKLGPRHMIASETRWEW